MRPKKQRQKQILYIMEGGHFHTQQEVARELQRRDFSVSQSTLSKDFKELNLVKTTAPDGTFKYVLPQQVTKEARVRTAHREIEDYVTSFDFTNNMVILKTAPANAPGVSETIDNAGWSEVIGNIAGDNTILLICRTSAQAKQLIRRIQDIMDGKKAQP